jgi:hypothetical protein
MAISYDLAGKILASALLDTPLTRATSGYLLLYQDDDPPDESGLGGTVIGNGHVAKNIDFNASTWTVTGMAATNDGIITGDANGTGAVTATHFGIWDDDDNLMFRGPLSAPIEITSGAPYQIAAGAIDFTIGGAFTDSFGNDVLDHILIGTAITWPDENGVEMSLVSTTPSAAAAGTEVTGTGYVRPEISPDSTSWLLTDNEAENASDIEFGVAASDWGDPVGHNVYAVTGGQRLFWLDYGAAQPLDSGNQALWRTGTLIIRIS